MLRLTPIHKGALRILCLGAHADDIEIGCGGTILELTGRTQSIDVTWIVLSGAGHREAEARSSAKQFLRGAKKSDIRVGAFRDGYFPAMHGDIKDYFERLKGEVKPDFVFTHAKNDLHQDHRLVAELTWNTFRDNMIFEYEIVKYDGDLGSPNAFVPVLSRNCERKIRILMHSFSTQRSRSWFTEDTFKAMLRLRGIECRSKSGYAEAFYVRKFLL